MSMEDESGIIKAIVTPATSDRYKFEVLSSPSTDSRRAANLESVRRSGVHRSLERWLTQSPSNA
jgi:hypothetical protein